MENKLMRLELQKLRSIASDGGSLYNMDMASPKSITGTRQNQQFMNFQIGSGSASKAGDTEIKSVPQFEYNMGTDNTMSESEEIEAGFAQYHS